MSRGPRDLRDLICVSRLTFKESDEEIISDDDRLDADFDNLSLGSSGSCDSRQGSAAKSSRLTGRRISPDSGCIANGESPPSVNNGAQTPVKDSELKLDLSGIRKKKSKRTKRKKKGLQIEPPRHDLPKQAPLPPVGRSLSHESYSTSVSRASSSDSGKLTPTPTSGFHSDTATNDKDSRNVTPRLKIPTVENPEPFCSTDAEADVDVESVPVNPVVTKHKAGLKKPETVSKPESGNFDEMLCFMDATIVSSWLTRANNSVSEVSTYILADDNFVRFAHFWLTDFPDIQKREIFELEIEILREELGFAFSVGRDQRKITQHDISNLIGAIFREYPARLISSKGNILFLDYLDILSSERTQKYKKLLSDVKCSTKNRQYAQWILATRSFCLVSMWSAIVNFYRNLLGKHGSTQGLPIPSTQSSHRNIHEKRLFQALKLGYTDVIHYLVISGLVNVRMIDSHERTLIFTAVMHNQPKVLHYFINRVKPPININHPSDTGNTALHAAANNGNVKLVAELVKSPEIDLNCRNPQCEDAAPLHLAVMHGHTSVVDELLKAGADRILKMGEMTAVDIARDFDHTDILALLEL